MGEFNRDPAHWLLRYSPDEWIHAALGELARARQAWEQGNGRAGAVGVKRAAGMALNAALIVRPEHDWGRTYVEHLSALAADESAPPAVRAASQRVLEAQPPGGDLVSLRTPRSHTSFVEAAHDVIAHAWAVVKKNEAHTD
jgi:HEPN domain-containing protein